MSMQAAVPLYMAELDGLPVATRLRIARHAGQVLACHGDVLQFSCPAKRRRKPGGEAKSTAEVFNIVAKGIAAAATLGCDVTEIFRSLEGGELDLGAELNPG